MHEASSLPAVFQLNVSNSKASPFLHVCAGPGFLRKLYLLGARCELTGLSWLFLEMILDFSPTRRLDWTVVQLCWGRVLLRVPRRT